jgi:hypothetical protein
MNKNFGEGIEKILNTDYIFTFIVIFQALFGGYGLVEKPKLLKTIDTHWLFRLFALMTIAYTATKQIEIAAMCVILFLIIMYLLRTPEERKKHGIL